MIKTADEVKKMTSDQDCIKVVNALFEAVAYAETVRALIEPKQQELIDFYKFETADMWTEKYGDPKRIITKYDHLYLASDEDSDLLYKEMHKVHLELGFKVEMNYCPLLIAEDLVRKVKVQVADFLEPYMGMSYDQISYSLDSYKMYFDLVMTMFAGVVKEYQKNKAKIRLYENN